MLFSAPDTPPPVIEATKSIPLLSENEKQNSFGLVVLTSVHETDTRLEERNRVLTSLCTGQNLALLQLHAFQVYISIDTNRQVFAVEVPPSCASLDIRFLKPPKHTEKTHAFASTPTGRISRHYKFALMHMFKKHTHALVLEDDLLPSEDFVSLFVPPSPAFALLQTRPERVWCISAWNDMGTKLHATNLERLFLTDFFPGLGWMMTKHTFDTLRLLHKWPEVPTTGWDNWLRANNELERVCIVPEVNRVAHISSSGVNVHNAHDYQVFAYPPEHHATKTEWELEVDLLQYEQQLSNRVLNAKRVTQLANKDYGQDILVIYERSQLRTTLEQLGVLVPMREEPRAALQGLITVRGAGGNHFVFLCDQVRCAPRFFPQERQWVKPTFNLYRATKGQSCDQACHEHGGRKCDDLNLQTIAYGGRACTLMRTYFSCEQGCGHQIGAELPAMAAVKSKIDTHGQCLLGESAVPRCSASHHNTQRLCSCV